MATTNPPPVKVPVEMQVSPQVGAYLQSQAMALYQQWVVTGSVGGIIVDSQPPGSSTASGVPGQVTWDSDYLYVCIDTDTWKVVPLQDFPS